MRERLLQIGRWSLWVILFLAIVLRVTYLVKTPYSVREHDVEAHIDYIEYMAEFGRIPAAADGWEYYQPPLYYAVSAVLWKAGDSAGWEYDTRLLSVQIFSVLLSIIFVVIAWWIGRMIFGHKRMEEWEAFVLIIAVFPSLLLTSSRITNDSLAVVMSGLTVAMLLQWYRSGKSRDWYLLAVVLSLALLTKMTAVLFVCVALGVFLWKYRAQWRQAVIPLLIFLLIIAALTAWYPAVRFHENVDRAVIPGVEGLDPGVLLPTKPMNFLTFNPVKVVEIPYNNPWDDASRRQYFWEYWFRSAFLGEWNFEERMMTASRAVLLGGLGLLVFAIVGLWMTVRRGWKAEWWVLPVVAVGLMLLAGAVGYRFVNTCSCAQDFRYSFPFVIPWGLFAAAGLASLPKKIRGAGWAWLLLCAAAVVVFFTVLPSMR